jgi:hypothetical protein
MIRLHYTIKAKRNHRALRLNLVPLEDQSPPVTLFEIDEGHVIRFAEQWREAATRAEQASKQ